MKERVVVNDGEDQEVEINSEGVFEVGQALLFYTRAPGRYQKNPQSKRL